jgi:hypothetical protein
MLFQTAPMSMCESTMGWTGWLKEENIFLFESGVAEPVS